MESSFQAWAHQLIGHINSSRTTDAPGIILITYHVGWMAWIAFQFKKLDMSTLEEKHPLYPMKFSKHNVPALIASNLAMLLGIGLNKKGRVIWRKVVAGLLFLALPAVAVEFLRRIGNH